METITKDEKKALRKIEWEEQLKKESRSKLINKILLWVGVVAFLGGGFWFILAASGTSSQPGQTVSVPQVTKADMTTGNLSSKVQVIEYSDFQCPSCGRVYPMLKQLQKDFGTQLSITYRYFPLTTVHKNALISSSAAFAANKQGKFWEMHDLLFDNQDKWAELDNPQDTFSGYAQTLGMNVDQFKKDLTDPKTAQYLNDQAQTDAAIGLTGTPSIFLQGKQITFGTYDELKGIIKTQLQSK